MRHLIAAALIAVTSVAANAQYDTGRWTVHQRSGSEVYIELRWPDNSDWHHTIDISELSGITLRDLQSSPKSIAFAIPEDAGRFEFDGKVGDGRGSGSFHFTPNRNFAAELRRIGIEGLGDISDWNLTNLAWGRFSAKSARGFLSLGLGPLDKNEMMDLAVQHVTPEFVKALRDLGVDGIDNVHDAVEARMFGATPEYVRVLNDAGVRGLTVSQIVDLRFQGVSADFIRAAKNAGLKNLTARELIEMRQRAYRGNSSR